MTTARCQPLTSPLIPELREAADPLAAFVSELADASCALAEKRAQLGALNSSDPRVLRASGRLETLEARLRELSVEVVAVHQDLLHERLV